MTTALRAYTWHGTSLEHVGDARKQLLEEIHDVAPFQHEHMFGAIVPMGCDDCDEVHGALLIVGPSAELPAIEEAPTLSQFLEARCGLRAAHNAPSDLVQRVWSQRSHGNGRPCACYDDGDV